MILSNLLSICIVQCIIILFSILLSVYFNVGFILKFQTGSPVSVSVPKLDGCLIIWQLVQTGVVLPSREDSWWTIFPSWGYLTEAVESTGPNQDATSSPPPPPPVRPWTSRRVPVSSSITTTLVCPAVGILKLRRLATLAAERRPGLTTTSRGSYTFSSMSGPGSRWRGRSGRWSGPSCR